MLDVSQNCTFCIGTSVRFSPKTIYFTDFLEFVMNLVLTQQVITINSLTNRETLCSGGEDSTNEMSCSSECISEPAPGSNNRLSEEEEKEILMSQLQITNDK